MNQTNQQNNNNNIIVLNDIKTSFNNDFAKQKNFTFNIYSIITITSAGIKELNPSLENINNILPYLIEQLGIPFCDLLNEANIIKYYFNNYTTTKSEIFKKIIFKIIFAFIEVFGVEYKNKLFTPFFKETILESKYLKELFINNPIKEIAKF